MLSIQEKERVYKRARKALQERKKNFTSNLFRPAGLRSRATRSRGSAAQVPRASSHPGGREPCRFSRSPALSWLQQARTRLLGARSSRMSRIVWHGVITSRPSSGRGGTRPPHVNGPRGLRLGPTGARTSAEVLAHGPPKARA